MLKKSVSLKQRFIITATVFVGFYLVFAVGVPAALAGPTYYYGLQSTPGVYCGVTGVSVLNGSGSCNPHSNGYRGGFFYWDGVVQGLPADTTSVTFTIGSVDDDWLECVINGHSFSSGTYDGYNEYCTGHSYTFYNTGATQLPVHLKIYDRYGGSEGGNISFSFTRKPPPITTSCSASPNPVNVNQATTLSGAASDPAGGTISQYAFDFGDGTSGTTVAERAGLDASQSSVAVHPTGVASALATGLGGLGGGPPITISNVSPSMTVQRGTPVSFSWNVDSNLRNTFTLTARNSHGSTSKTLTVPILSGGLFGMAKTKTLVDFLGVDHALAMGGLGNGYDPNKPPVISSFDWYMPYGTTANRPKAVAASATVRLTWSVPNMYSNGSSFVTDPSLVVTGDFSGSSLNPTGTFDTPVGNPPTITSNFIPAPVGKSGTYRFVPVYGTAYTITATDYRGTNVYTLPVVVVPAPITHTYTRAGTYIVKVTATSSAGNSGIGSCAVTVLGPTYSISGRVFDDINKNGVFDSGEVGLSGQNISTSGPAAKTTATDANGQYKIASLPAGQYQVSVQIPSGYTAETASSVSVSLAKDETRDFPLIKSSTPTTTPTPTTTSPTSTSTSTATPTATPTPTPTLTNAACPAGQTAQTTTYTFDNFVDGQTDYYGWNTVAYPNTSATIRSAAGHSGLGLQLVDNNANTGYTAFVGTGPTIRGSASGSVTLDVRPHQTNGRFEMDLSSDKGTFLYTYLAPDGTFQYWNQTSSNQYVRIGSQTYQANQWLTIKIDWDENQGGFNFYVNGQKQNAQLLPFSYASGGTNYVDPAVGLSLNTSGPASYTGTYDLDNVMYPDCVTNPKTGPVNVVGDIFSGKNVNGINVDPLSVVAAIGQINVGGSKLSIPGYQPTGQTSWEKASQKVVDSLGALEKARGIKLGNPDYALPNGAVASTFNLNPAGKDPSSATVNQLQPEGGVWVVNGDLTITAPFTFRNIGTVIVHGQITLNGSGVVTVDNGSLGLAALGRTGVPGDITLGPNVTNIQGIAFFAQGTVRIK